MNYMSLKELFNGEDAERGLGQYLPLVEKELSQKLRLLKLNEWLKADHTRQKQRLWRLSPVLAGGTNGIL